MESKPPFRVVIVGGSIAGLSLANMLQKVGIDFLVLEAYPDIAPQVGASIGLNGFGLRILDQIDCYDDIRAVIAPLNHVLLREGKTGRLLAEHKGLYKVQEERHGYPTCFLDRQSVLQILYDHIQDKSKILTSTRVMTTTQTENGVTVTTDNGTVYHGDILVGCDGIHSTVRREMWRQADESQPGWFPASEKTAMKVTYGCIYGISIEENIKPGHVHGTWHEHKSHGVMTGAGGRVYWFLMFNTGKVHHMPNVPRYTLEDEKAFAEKYSSNLVTGDLTIGDLYKRKISSTMTSLPEHCYKKWYYNRLITIGDSSHVFHPISGQGGNGALPRTCPYSTGNLTGSTYRIPITDMPYVRSCAQYRPNTDLNCSLAVLTYLCQYPGSYLRSPYSRTNYLNEYWRLQTTRC